jgi:hypothetical protein
MIFLLVFLLEPALLFVEANQYRYFFHALIAAISDIVIAHTSWAWLTGWPKKGEWTISHTLERLCKEEGPDQQLYIELAKKINRISPTGDHIKAVLKG